MSQTQKIAGIVVGALLAASIYGFYRTNQPYAVLENGANTSASAKTLVDQTPLTTAQRLAQMTTSEAEQPFVENALNISDHDMDLAYAAAERDLENHPPQPTPEAKQIQARLTAAENALEADNALVARLTADAAKAAGPKKDALDSQLVVAKAHQDEHQDEVDDAKEDLLRAGGDAESRIQAMMAEHKASSDTVDNFKLTIAPDANERGLIHRFGQWSALHQKQLALWNAKQEADSAAASFSAKHNALEAKLNGAKVGNSQSSGAAAGTNSAPTTTTDLNADETAALVNTAKARSESSKKLTGYDKRIDDQKQLAGNYANWIVVLANKQRAVVHRILTGVMLILVIVLLGLFFDGWLERVLEKTSLDRRQVETLRGATRVSLQVLGVLFILLVIFGPPNQLGTILGLAGAGLTVALKDFIVGFIGWLVLMGKNGIRLGDWVEINGVTGEVVELGMFHTVLLETGNWTDSGHPTGRRVTFTNSYAIEGHYFNFSTSGQWLWDELQLVIPQGKDPYPIVDAFQKKVLEATAESAKQAEKEWQSLARPRGGTPSLTAAPAINVKPVVGGVEIAVRYITRASERYQMRAKLNETAVDLLGQGHIVAQQPAGTA
ncbi:MAG TPA: mechanosensitive ion channel domain-containing protein [Candidatus Acidoferrum sp.]|nr:mechanosensitive ion channel domain-containing protein [Candidatus Acidoferrum sp.]